MSRSPQARTTAAAPAAAPYWQPAARVAFRFCVIYFTLYTLAGQIFGGVFLYPGFAPALGTMWPLEDLTLWAAEHVFGGTPPFVYTGNSGDTLFHWVQTFLLLSAAVAGTIAWSALDRRRTSYETLYTWFRLYLRFALAAQMFYYGMAKVIPTQFPPPALVTLVQPVGQLSLTDVLWLFVGASTAYQMFTGWAELVAGILLVIPHTAALGAIIALLDMVQVFVLNMTYDFGLKQISFHLILISLLVLAPDLRRLANVLVLRRPAEPAVEPPLFRTPEANRMALVAQIAFGAFLLVMFTNLTMRFYVQDGGTGAPKSPLYGIWEVEEMAVDGEVRHPLLNDYDRQWRRAIFDFTDRMFFQRWDDSYAAYGVSVNEARRTISLTKGTSRTWSSTFSYERPTPDTMIIEGEMDGQQIRAELERVGEDTFRILNSPFRWVRPPTQAGG